MLRSVNMHGMDKAQSIEVENASLIHTIRHIYFIHFQTFAYKNIVSKGTNIHEHPFSHKRNKT